jgi:hypothetical protein
MCNVVILEKERKIIILQKNQSEHKSFCTIKEDDKTLKLYSTSKAEYKNSWNI